MISFFTLILTLYSTEAYADLSVIDEILPRLSPAPSALKLLGRGIVAKSSDLGLALSCEHFEYPEAVGTAHLPLSEAFIRTECNAFRVILFRSKTPYYLSVTVTVENEKYTPANSRLSLNTAAYRLFHEFLPHLRVDQTAPFFESFFDKDGWNWSGKPTEISDADLYNAVASIFNSIRPVSQSPEFTFRSLPLVNWRIWSDYRYPERSTLFL